MKKDDEQFLEKYFKRPVAYWANLAKATGSVKLAVLLSQLWYWKDKGHDPDGWVYKTRESIYDETGLSRQEQETARKLGRELGIIREVKRRIPPVVHFLIDTSELVKLLKSYEAGNKPINRRKSPQFNNQNVSKRQEDTKPNIYTENTAKITSENTQKNTGANRRRDFTKKFFKQAKDWKSSRNKMGVELENVINWLKKHYEPDALEELNNFIDFWTKKGQINYGDDESKELWEQGENEYFVIFPRLRGWMAKADIKIRDP